MANVLHRATKEYRESVNTPDYDATVWLINPDLSNVKGFDSKYWLIVDDAVTLMSDEQRADYDAKHRSVPVFAYRSTYRFFMTGTSVRNIYLTWSGLSSAPPVGGPVLALGNPWFILSQCQAGSVVLEDTTFSVFKNDEVTPFYSMILPKGSNAVSDTNIPNIPLNINDRLHVYVTNLTSGIMNPSMQIDIGWA